MWNYIKSPFSYSYSLSFKKGRKPIKIHRIRILWWLTIICPSTGYRKAYYETTEHTKEFGRFLCVNMLKEKQCTE